jgi:hypothetical protein
MSVDISHYLNSLLRKPGAVRNSVALKSVPRLKAIYETHYRDQPRKFIELFMEHKEKSIGEIIKVFEEMTRNPAEIKALHVVKPLSRADVSARAMVTQYASLINRGVGENGGCADAGEAAEPQLHTG